MDHATERVKASTDSREPKDRTADQRARQRPSADGATEDLQLQRQIEYLSRRVEDLNTECDGLRDWAESVQQELDALKSGLWFKLFGRKSL